MTPFFRKIALWLLGWLQGKVDPDLAKKLEEYREQAKRLDATVVATKKEINKLEMEWKALHEERTQLHIDLAGVESDIEKLEEKIIEARQVKDAERVPDASALRDSL